MSETFFVNLANEQILITVGGKTTTNKYTIRCGRQSFILNFKVIFCLCLKEKSSLTGRKYALCFVPEVDRRIFSTSADNRLIANSCAESMCLHTFSVMDQVELVLVTVSYGPAFKKSVLRPV